jgi:hypothetical protein
MVEVLALLQPTRREMDGRVRADASVKFEGAR